MMKFYVPSLNSGEPLHAGALRPLAQHQKAACGTFDIRDLRSQTAVLAPPILRHDTVTPV
jgi:hypothetical protein